MTLVLARRVAAHHEPTHEDATKGTNTCYKEPPITFRPLCNNRVLLKPTNLTLFNIHSCISMCTIYIAAHQVQKDLRKTMPEKKITSGSDG